jgi:hypothetical protein
MSKICENRLSFLYRDIESFYEENDVVLKDLLRLMSAH